MRSAQLVSLEFAATSAKNGSGAKCAVKITTKFVVDIEGRLKMFNNEDGFYDKHDEIGQQNIHNKTAKRIEREKIRNAAEIVRILLQKPLIHVEGQGVTDVEDLDSLVDVKGKNINVATAMIVAQAKKAIEKGDTKAMQVLFSLTGDYKEHSDVEVKADPFKGLSLEELRKIANLEEPLE